MGWEGLEGKTGMWAQASSVPVWGFVFPLACSSNGANVFSSLRLQFATLPSSFRWIGLPAGLGCFSLNASSCFTSAMCTFCLCALSQSWVLLAHDAAPSTSCEYNSDFASSLSSPAYHFLLLPSSTYVSLA